MQAEGPWLGRAGGRGKVVLGLRFSAARSLADWLTVWRPWSWCEAWRAGRAAGSAWTPSCPAPTWAGNKSGVVSFELFQTLWPRGKLGECKSWDATKSKYFVPGLKVGYSGIYTWVFLFTCTSCICTQISLLFTSYIGQKHACYFSIWKVLIYTNSVSKLCTYYHYNCYCSKWRYLNSAAV